MFIENGVNALQKTEVPVLFLPTPTQHVSKMATRRKKHLNGAMTKPFFVGSQSWERSKPNYKLIENFKNRVVATI